MSTFATKQAVIPNKLQSFVRATVRQELESLFSDPDFGLALRLAVKRRLSLARKVGSGELVSATFISVGL